MKHILIGTLSGVILAGFCLGGSISLASESSAGRARVITYEEFMRLSAAKQEKYMQSLRQVVTIMEGMQIKAKRAYLSAQQATPPADDLNSKIATVMNLFAILPSANADDIVGNPVWDLEEPNLAVGKPAAPAVARPADKAAPPAPARPSGTTAGATPAIVRLAEPRFPSTGAADPNRVGPPIDDPLFTKMAPCRGSFSPTRFRRRSHCGTSSTSSVDGTPSG